MSTARSAEGTDGPEDFNRNEFRTTLMLENAIAAAAKTGLSRMPKNGYKTPAATGTKAEL